MPQPRIAILLLLLLTACFAGSQESEFQPKPPATAESADPTAFSGPVNIQALEKSVHRRINEKREEAGLSPLEWNEELSRVARAYSGRMAQEGFMSHKDPSGDDATERVSEAGLDYRAVGENLFRVRHASSQTAVLETTIEGWMESPGHRENLLRGFQQTGVGVARRGNTFYLTQLFMSPRFPH